ncbi:hypothetical protein BZG36_00083 [Bifiguratus adelaidae]|uniref:Vacuolar-sorting protein SNF7 n=1 Tax=Bifiguratus adelaidae TaxID=1938954 RepID=A0A261Y8V5_9FUNG|nr:hypothetical protein BZG36_00083 [Bifiguratus adelaidae]
MELFKWAFAKKVDAKATISSMREMLTQLEKRQTYIESRIQQELHIAKVNASRNKRVALLALKKKRLFERQIEKLSGARLTLESQLITLDNTQVDLRTLETMKMGNDAMKSIHSSMSIDKVDQTMDDIQDQMDIANEISHSIAQPIGIGDQYDEDELLTELEELEQLELNAKILGEPSSLRMPTVPQADPPVEDETYHQELAQLQMSMAV